MKKLILFFKKLSNLTFQIRNIMESTRSRFRISENRRIPDFFFAVIHELNNFLNLQGYNNR